MDKLEQEKMLYDELGRLLERFTREFDMTYGQVLGVIKLIEYDLVEQNKNQGEYDE
jgi:hypothetical protein